MFVSHQSWKLILHLLKTSKFASFLAHNWFSSLYNIVFFKPFSLKFCHLDFRVSNCLDVDFICQSDRKFSSRMPHAKSWKCTPHNFLSNAPTLVVIQQLQKAPTYFFKKGHFMFQKKERLIIQVQDSKGAIPFLSTVTFLVFNL